MVQKISNRQKENTSSVIIMSNCLIVFSLFSIFSLPPPPLLPNTLHFTYTLIERHQSTNLHTYHSHITHHSHHKPTQPPPPSYTPPPPPHNPKPHTSHLNFKFNTTPLNLHQITSQKPPQSQIDMSHIDI